MAERRMFSCKITSSDAFKMMSLAAQALYFHLGMEADDDGFVNNPISITRSIGATVENLDELISKRFVLRFTESLVVIKHWKINNWIRKDMYKETAYQQYREKLVLKDNGAYTEADKEQNRTTSEQPCNETVTDSLRNRRIGKDRIGKDSKEKVDTIVSPEKKSFRRPSVEEVRAYCDSRNNGIDAEAFCDFYESKGWKVGNTPMKDWQASVRTWEKAGSRAPQAQSSRKRMVTDKKQRSMSVNADGTLNLLG